MTELLNDGYQDENARIAATWNSLYANKMDYALAQPLPFTSDIIRFAGEHIAPGSHGLYIGHGAGRNFKALVQHGLDLDGIDLSEEATAQVAQELPGLKGKLMTGDYRELEGGYDYIIAMQAFHYGTAQHSHEHFAHAARLLNPGGFLFLSTHAASTSLDKPHALLEGEEGMSRTVVYSKDPSSAVGIPIHYYDQAELEAMAQQNGFTIVAPLRETRSAPENHPGTMRSEWETIWQVTG